MPQQPATVSKAEFAELCNVHPSRVSHWIKDRKIRGEALVGEGRGARIVVAVAQKQLKSRLDPYQRMPGANGAGTRLDAKPASSVHPDDEVEGSPLSDDAAQIMAVLSQVPALAAWDAAVSGETTQRAFDAFMNLRLNVTSEMRLRGFTIDDDDLETVNWSGLAEEMGMTLIDPAAMHADWDRRRLAD